MGVERDRLDVGQARGALQEIGLMLRAHERAEHDEGGIRQVRVRLVGRIRLRQLGQHAQIEGVGLVGAIKPDHEQGAATLHGCGAEGVVLDATPNLFVSPPITDPLTQEDFYSASFDGPLDVSGSFTGTVIIQFAFFEWSDPPREENTTWEVSASVEGRQVFASSFGSNMEPNPNGNVTSRFGSTCVFDDGNFLCEELCPSVYLSNETLTDAFCTVENVCECFCALNGN